LIRIKVCNLSKKFDLDIAHNDGALAAFLRLLKAGEKQERQALQEVSFEAGSGEIIGLVGRNGSGKTTLLRILGGIYLPDGGSVEINGKAVYLAGYAQGLVPKLTMLENIQLVGTMRGLSPQDLRRKLDEIIAFSGLEEYTHIKVYQFSSGMINRLAFSTTIHSIEKHNPDILLIDEALGSSGDIDFQEKAMQKLNEFVRKSSAVILASHRLGIIRKYCNRALWIEKGQIQKSGNPDDVVNDYVFSKKEQTTSIK